MPFPPSVPPFFLNIYFLILGWWCRCWWRPEEDIRFPGIGITGGCELPELMLGTGPGSSRRAASTLTAEPSLQLQGASSLCSLFWEGFLHYSIVYFLYSSSFHYWNSWTRQFSPLAFFVVVFHFFFSRQVFSLRSWLY